MGLLGIKVPEDISKLLRRISVPGDRDPTDHITLFYFEESLSTKEIAKLCEILPAKLEKWFPIDITIKKINCFEKGNDGVPIKAEVSSKDLEQLRKELASILDKNKISFSKKWPEFKPHVTVSYHSEKIKDLKLEKPIKWTASELILWPAEYGDQGMNVHFPLGKDDKLTKKLAKVFYQLVSS